MLDELSWETLKYRRIQLQLTNLYKIQHNLIDVEASTYLTKRSTTVRSKHSSNSLPTSVAEAPSLAQFKKKLSIQPF